jgi:iron complex transport system substrate-binding protein
VKPLRNSPAGSKGLRNTFLAIFLSLALLCTGCFHGQDEGRTVTVTDMAGRAVQVPAQPEKVVGVGAGALRLIVYFDAVEKVVGVEDIEKRDRNRPYIMAHPELADLPCIGPIRGGDAEAIVAQDPEVIFWTYTTPADADDLQAKTGIPVVVIDYGDLGENRTVLYEALTLMGQVLGRQDRAEDLIAYMEEVIADLARRTADVPDDSKPSVYVGGIGFRGPRGVLSTEPSYEPLAFVNGKNVAAGLGTEHAMIDSEMLLEWDPDFILVDRGNVSLVLDDLRRPEFGHLQAVREGRLYGVLPFNYYTCNYATVLVNAYYIGKLLYPARFADVDPTVKADEIYEVFLGKPVYESMVDAFGGFGIVEVDDTGP